jgi:hypothetical protein
MRRRHLLAPAAALLAGAGLPWTAAAARPRPAATGRQAVIEAVQMPAWLERGDAREPVAPGQAVVAGDRLETGEGAALSLRLPEGSTVRLGAKTKLEVPALEASAAAGSTAVAGRLQLLDGFLRFSTSALSGVTGQRELQVQLRSATIGIRGTDFWTMTDDAHDAACLFEGKVALSTRDQGELVLAQPTAFWARFFAQPVQPVGHATPQQLQTFLGSTELVAGRGVAITDGLWRVVAATLPAHAPALALARRLRLAGYPARVAERPDGLQVRIDGLSSNADAQAVLARIGVVEGVSGRVARMA